jgi:chromosome segregation ATPase
LWDLFSSRQLDRIEQTQHEIIRRLQAVAISQEQFDTDLKALTDSITALIAAVEAAIAAKPPADLTAEDQAVQDAAQQVSDELAKLNPPT